MSPLIDFRKRAISLAMFTLISFAAVGTAKATPLVFDLTQGNPGLQSCAGCTGPYATVTVTQTSTTTATITFQGLTQGTNIYLFGGAQAIDLNFNGGPVVVNTSSVAFGPTGLSGPTANSADGFGNFNFTLDNFDGFTNAFSSITLTVTCATCNWLADSSNVLVNNANGNIAAAHIFVSCPDCTGARATGFASNGTPSTETPEPATMILLGTGLLGVGATARRRFRKSRK